MNNEKGPLAIPRATPDLLSRFRNRPCGKTAITEAVADDKLIEERRSRERDHRRALPLHPARHLGCLSGAARGVAEGRTAPDGQPAAAPEPGCGSRHGFGQAVAEVNVKLGTRLTTALLTVAARRFGWPIPLQHRHAVAVLLGLALQMSGATMPNS
jgi:hypothetical protein